MKPDLLNSFPWLTELLACIFGTSGLLSAFAQKRKNKTDALQAMQKAYDGFVADAQEMNATLKRELNELAEKYDKVVKKCEELEKLLDQYKNANS